MPEPRYFSKDLKTLGKARNRSIRHKKQPPVKQIFLSKFSRSPLRLLSTMELGPSVRLSPLSPHSKGPKKVVLIASFWPKRAWFSFLKALSESDPWVLPETENLLHQGPVFHPPIKGLHLTAWLLNGRSSGQKGSLTL